MYDVGVSRVSLQRAGLTGWRTAWQQGWGGINARPHASRPTADQAENVISPNTPPLVPSAGT